MTADTVTATAMRARVSMVASHMPSTPHSAKEPSVTAASLAPRRLCSPPTRQENRTAATVTGNQPTVSSRSVIQLTESSAQLLRWSRK